jgi:hypothetical protein
MESPKTCLRGDLTRDHFIHVAPNPIFSGLDRPHHGMFTGVKMLRGMFVLRRIAAAHVAAGYAQPQVDPGVTKFYALFADADIGVGDFDLIQVFAFLCHGLPRFLRGELFRFF